MVPVLHQNTAAEKVCPFVTFVANLNHMIHSVHGAGNLNNSLPPENQVVIIGCSVAYHLAKSGCPDVVLLEREQLTSGTA
jgi:hypothetical protein